MSYTFVGQSPQRPMVRHYVVDVYDDIATIRNISQLLPGSTAFVIDTSKTYMLKHDGTWQEIATGGGGGGEVIYDGGDEDQSNTPQHIIYDGGSEDG